MSTIQTRITVQQHISMTGNAEIGGIVGAVAEAACEIAKHIRYAGMREVHGAAGATNVQGEQQQKLDVIANELIKSKLGALLSVAAVVSEEEDVPAVFEHKGQTYAGDRYVVIHDPLDGSSNIDVNVNVGTIFSVQKANADVNASVLQAGTEQVAAGFVVYGPSVVLVTAVKGADVAVFTLDENLRFVRTTEKLMLPEQGPYYSVNEATEQEWPAGYRAFVEGLKREGLNGQPYGGRYVGSLVADLYRTMLKGGVFLYPPTKKSPEGKLRLLYEANPVAMLVEQAGGMAVNGAERILSAVPTKVHQRTPLVFGSKAEVTALMQRMAEAR